MLETIGKMKQKICIQMKENNKPKIDADYFFFITLRRLQIASLPDSEVGTEKTTERMLAILREYPAITMKELCGKLNISWSRLEYPQTQKGRRIKAHRPGQGREMGSG